MRIFFAGTPDFAVPSLMVLADDPEIEIEGVFSQPPRPRGRGQKIKPTPVSLAAQKLKLPVNEIQNINNEENLNFLNQKNFDFLVVVAFGQKLSKELLNIPQKGAVNLHASLLPRYRGANPIQRALLNGDKISGLSTMLMDEGWDTGLILKQKTISVEKDETFKTLHDKMAREGAPLLLESLKQFLRGEIRPKEQTGEVVYASKLTRADMKLQWGKSADFLERQIRALNPFPGARAEYNGEEWKVFQASVTGDIPDFEPGEIKVLNNKELIVQTGKGALALKKLQRPGKKPLGVEEFLRGFSVEDGSRFNGKGEGNA